MKKIIAYGLISVAIIVIVLIVMFKFSGSELKIKDETEKELDMTKEDLEINEAVEKELSVYNSIVEEIERANYCDINEDCTILEEKCPFDQPIVNKNEADRIQGLINSYKSDCAFGRPLCLIVDAKCINNKCESVCE